MKVSAMLFLFALSLSQTYSGVSLASDTEEQLKPALKASQTVESSAKKEGQIKKKSKKSSEKCKEKCADKKSCCDTEMGSGTEEMGSGTESKIDK